MALFPYGIPKTEKKATSNLFVDWKSTKKALVEGLSKDKSLIIDKVIQNQKESLKNSSPNVVNLADSRKVIMPMIRKILPTTIAQDIIGVQPMTGPTGSIFTMNIDKPLTAVRLIIEKVDNHWNIKCEGVTDHNLVSKIEAWLSSLEDWEYWTYQKGPWRTFYVNLYDAESVNAFRLTWDGYDLSKP